MLPAHTVHDGYSINHSKCASHWVVERIVWPFADVADAATSKQADTDDEAKRSSSSQDPAQVNGISLSIPFQLRSTDELQSPFTNYVRGYSGLLDYIWYEPQRLKVERAIPLPSLEEVQAFIPSQRFPSDHLSVSFCCTLPVWSPGHVHRKQPYLTKPVEHQLSVVM